MRDAEPLELEAARAELVETAMSELFLRFPPLAGYSETQLARTREDLGYILQFLEAALLTDDPRLFLDEFLPWLGAVLDAFPRGRELLVRARQLAADRALDG